MSNPLSGICGVYKLTERRISFDTSIPEEVVKKILQKFHDDKKALRMGEYIVLPSWPKHQNWESSPKIKQGIINELAKLNDTELRFVYECGYKFPMDDLLKKREIIVEKPIQDRYSMDTLPIQDRYSMDTPPTILLNSDSIKLNKEFIGNSNTNSKNPDCENPVDNSRPPPNPFIFIKEKVKAIGYYIDDPVVKKIAKSIEPEWLTERHSIIDFVNCKINDIYSDKPKEERKKLFISALTKWENIHDEYSDWLNKKIKAAEEHAKNKLRDTPPSLCPKCHTDMSGARLCPKCNGTVVFCEEDKTWKYNEPIGLLSEAFRQEVKKKYENGTSPPKEEDIEF
jgi:hypothetical protein